MERMALRYMGRKDVTQIEVCYITSMGSFWYALTDLGHHGGFRRPVVFNIEEACETKSQKKTFV